MAKRTPVQMGHGAPMLLNQQRSTSAPLLEKRAPMHFDDFEAI